MFPVTLPPLRERRDDIPLLLKHFLLRCAKKAGKSVTRIDTNTVELCMEYDWPGNIRELRNIVERAVIISESNTLFIAEGWLRPMFSRFSEAREGLSTLAVREVEMIESALAQSNGRISGSSGAAMKLRIPRQTLESKMKRLGINKYGHRLQLAGSRTGLQPAAVSA